MLALEQIAPFRRREKFFRRAAMVRIISLRTAGESNHRGMMEIVIQHGIEFAAPRLSRPAKAGDLRLAFADED